MGGAAFVCHKSPLPRLIAAAGGFYPILILKFLIPFSSHRKTKSAASAVPLGGGDNEIRTRGLYVANVPLYQLSHIPMRLCYDYSIT